tara:strand:+ start:388 stop:1494 length:1107 start_codon:yes stop_codon:yes gene_type:complete
MNSKQHIAIVYLGNFFFDARLINMSLSLQQNNYRVTIVDIHTTRLQSTLFNNIHFSPITLQSCGKLKYLEFHRKAKALLKQNQYDVIISGDLYSLSAVCAFKNKTKKIIYDCREIYFELAAHINKPLYKYWNYNFERYYLKYVDQIIVTANTDLQYLKETYQEFKNLKWNIIYNYPYSFKKNEGTSNMCFNKNNIKVIYQGVLQKGRGIKLLLDVAKSNNYIDAIIVGSGEHEQYYKQYNKKHNRYNNVFFIDMVPYLELLNITSNCDIGWAVITKQGLSNKFALPNKLFEYLMARLPVIGSDLPNITNVIVKYDVGKIITDISINTITKTINDIYNNKNLYRHNAQIASQYFNWDAQHNQFMEIINE